MGTTFSPCSSDEPHVKRVLSIGQCGVDHASISRFLRDRFDAEVQSADDGDEAVEQLSAGAFDLVLVNRVLDRTGGDGLAVVENLMADPGRGNTPVMLVTNFPDWQQRAVALGAVAGFGKADLHSPAAADRVAPYLTANPAEED